MYPVIGARPLIANVANCPNATSANTGGFAVGAVGVNVLADGGRSVRADAIVAGGDDRACVATGDVVELGAGTDGAALCASVVGLQPVTATMLISAHASIDRRIRGLLSSRTTRR